MVCFPPHLVEQPPNQRLIKAGGIEPGRQQGLKITAGGTSIFDELDQQRLRILQCTARAMASSPGGLRFKPGTRPWLEGLAPSR